MSNTTLSFSKNKAEKANISVRNLMGKEVYQSNYYLEAGEHRFLISFGTPGVYLASDEEWSKLERYLGMSPSEADSLGWRNSGLVGGKIKETGINHWFVYNKDASNSSSFTALPSGSRSSNGGFSSYSLWLEAFFWTSSESNPYSIYRALHHNSDAVRRGQHYRRSGFSVRCIKDE